METLSFYCIYKSGQQTKAQMNVYMDITIFEKALRTAHNFKKKKLFGIFPEDLQPLFV